MSMPAATWMPEVVRALVAAGGDYLDRRSIIYGCPIARMLSGRGRIHVTRDAR